MSQNETWKSRRDVALTFAGVLTPLIVAGLGGWFAYATKDSENRVRYVELAITQLRPLPSPETMALREWAIELLNDQAPVKLPASAKEQLRSSSLSATAPGGSLTFKGSGSGGEAFGR